ncbi:MAG TPA: hypothetical protein VEI25_05420 [Paraburkholderia sp.]|nr:hypothetical protein [Paraburkholderia sp.]
MNRPVSGDSSRLPEGFEDLEEFVDRWSVPTSHERWARRAAMPYAEIERFYKAMMARADDAAACLEQFPLDVMPAPAQRLFQLMLAMCHAAIAVEVHQAPTIRHAPQQHALRIVKGFQPHG